MKKSITLLFILSTVFIACGRKDAGSLPEPEIMNGNAELLVKITHSDPENPCEISGISIMLSLPVTGEEIRHYSAADERSDYLFNIPVECSPLTGILNVITMKDMYSAFLLLDAHGKNELHIELDSVGSIIKANMEPSFGLTSYDRINFTKSFYDFVMYQQVTSPTNGMTMAEYQSKQFENLKERSEYALNRYELSDNVRGCLQDMFNILFIPSSALGISDFNVRYYEYLKDYDLNDPRYLLNYLFRDAVRSILYNPLFEIPAIGETPVDEWLGGVKATLADLVGFDNGQFYDLLVSNAYARQLVEETRPLSEKQIDNIRDYFRGSKSAFAEILLRKNTETQKLSAGVGELTVHDAADVPNEALLDAILAPHKGKVVVVDFWATWCQPCVAAMKEIKKVKALSGHDNIAFVYLTGSSDRKLWEKMIKDIGGNHYFLNPAQWDYLMDHFGFEYIPSYVIFGPDGGVRKKFGSYPGNDRFREALAN